MIKWNTAYNIDNVFCVNLTNVTMLLFVLRIQNSRAVAYLICAIMFIMSIINIVTAAMVASQCRPWQNFGTPLLLAHALTNAT